MIRPAAVAMGAVMVAISTGTYYGLDLLPAGLIPPPIGRAVAAEAAPPAAAPVVVAVAPVAAEPAGAAAPEAAAPEVTEQDLAEEPPPPAPAPVTPARVTPASAPAPADAAAAETEPAPEPTQTAKAESPAAAAPAPARAAPEADVLKPWWPDPATIPANQLKLQYAGQVKGQGAIALLFSAPLQLETLQQHATVKSASGETLAGSWTIGKNPKLAVLDGLAPGRYTVILQPQVADTQGFMLGATLTGPVYVKAP